MYWSLDPLDKVKLLHDFLGYFASIRPSDHDFRSLKLSGHPTVPLLLRAKGYNVRQGGFLLSRI